MRMESDFCLYLVKVFAYFCSGKMLSLLLTPLTRPQEIDGGRSRRSRKGIRVGNRFDVIYGDNVMSAELLQVSLLGVGAVFEVFKGMYIQWSLA